MNIEIPIPDRTILTARGARNAVDPWKPYHFLNESEMSAAGIVEDVSTIFLTNRECPFRCVMCDLWKNTTDDTVPPGAIPAQIDFALSRLAPAQHVKLYNSGNFFDAKAIPPADFAAIADRVRHFQTVIVENHPRLCDVRSGEFQQLLGTQLEIALGLETSHAATLASLNKQMTVEDFARACELLLKSQIQIRAFILLKPPWTTEEQGAERAIESVRFAFNCGVRCCSVIPVRTGNGIMEQLRDEGVFTPPRLSSLETVMREVLSWNRGRVFADLWDAKQFADDPAEADLQIARLEAMNLKQCLN
ncbi:MAG: radical SAM protein [Planctomycetota bacterium]|nr:radical SAM protein [Planctomycetota bacterium]